MGYFLQLALDGGVELRMRMAVEVCPNGGVRVEVLIAADIAKDRPLAGRNHDRLAFEPILHLCEWMPDVTMIQFSEPVHSNAECEVRNAERDRAA